MAGIRVLIVDDVPETRESVRRLLEFEKDMQVIGEAGAGSEAVELAERMQPDVVLMDINMPDMNGIQATELLALRVPDCSVIIMSVQNEQDYLRRSMVAGAREYIVKPFTGGELVNTIARVYEVERRKRKTLGDQTVLPTSAHKTRLGHILSFFSTKGGVGQTSLATNLAVELARSGQYKVLLVDLNLQFGDICAFLNLAPKRSIADLSQSNSLQYQDISSFLLTHSTGIQVLAAPARPEYADLVSVEQVEQILKEVKPYFDFIVCDTVSRFDEMTILSLDLADKIFLVVGVDVPALKNTKLSLETMKGLHYLDKVTPILNRTAKEMGLEIEDIEKALGCKVNFELPSDSKNFTQAVNQGIPLVNLAPQCRAVEEIRSIAQTLISEPSPAIDKPVKDSSTSFKLFRRVLSTVGG